MKIRTSFALSATLFATSVYGVEERTMEISFQPFFVEHNDGRFEPTYDAYHSAVKETKRRLRAGDASACVNPQDGPWMQVVTTTQIGFEVMGVGILSGRKGIHQVTAAEQALVELERDHVALPCGG